VRLTFTKDLKLFNFTPSSIESWSTLSSVNAKKEASNSGSSKTKALQIFQNSTDSADNGAHANSSVPLALIDISLRKRPKAKEQPKRPVAAFNYSDTSALAHLLCSHLPSVSNVDSCVDNLSHTPNAQSARLDLLCAGKTCRLACEIVHEENLLRVGRGRRRRLAGASPCAFTERPRCSSEEARLTFCAIHRLDDHACTHVEQRKNYRVLCHNHHHNCTPVSTVHLNTVNQSTNY
jgi:hypothetical protein